MWGLVGNPEDRFSHNEAQCPRLSDKHSLYCKHSKIQTIRFYYGLIPANGAKEVANSEDPDQTAFLVL